MDISKEAIKWSVEKGFLLTTKKGGKSLTDFLSARDDIKKILDSGLSKINTWRFLTEKNIITCHYQTFLKYVAKYITGNTQSSLANSNTKSNIKAANSLHRKPIVAQAPKLPEFEWNADSRNIDHLL